jgi:hypothetical protein
MVMLVLSQVVVMPTALAQGKGTKIHWSQRPVTATVTPGVPYSTTVVFTSTVDLTNATIRLTPSLKGSTVVSPTSFASILAGQPYTLEISVTVPLSTSRMSYNGTLTVRTGHRAYALPLGLRFRVQH